LVIVLEIAGCRNVHLHWNVCANRVVTLYPLADKVLSICICGGGPSGHEYDHYIGGRFWHNPGAFANGFQGVCSVFVTGMCQTLCLLQTFTDIRYSAAFAFG